jgi:hypothetical protein
MNLLCPNCQKMLTVPEQYAGQLMKCPMCSTNFTVPALPPGGAPEPPPAPAFAAEPSPPPPPDTYGVKHDPVPAFAPPPAPPAPPPAPPVPAFATTSPSPTLGSTITDPGKSSSPLPPPKAGDYTDGWRVVFDPKVLQYVPAAALLLVFVLQFFPWVGVYVGGIPVTTQGAWGAAVGGYSKPDMDLTEFFEFKTDKEAQEKFDDKNASGNDPQFSLLIFFYLLPLFFVTLAASVGVVALPYIQVPLPPQVQQILPWKWAIVAGLNSLLLLFLLLQYVLPFSLENRVAANVASNPVLKEDPKGKTDVEKTKEVKRGEQINRVQRTFWWRMVVLLHIVATAAAGLVYWVERRGPAKPLPALELRW